MADHKYPCPKCGAVLKPANPIPAGKKIKCPKCATVFAPAATGEKEKEKAKAVVKKPPADEDEEGGTYGVFKEPEPEPEPEEEVEGDEDDEGKPKKPKKRDMVDEILNKRVSKNKKGAAQALIQRSTNQMLGTGTITCVGCLITVCVMLWPIVFSNAGKTRVEVLGLDWPIWLWISLCVVAFIYNGAVAVGAVKMQSIESYQWAMVATILIMLPFNFFFAVGAYAWFLMFVEKMLGSVNLMAIATIFVICAWFVYTGIWNFVMLRKPDVIAAFNQKSDY